MKRPSRAVRASLITIIGLLSVSCVQAATPTAIPKITAAPSNMETDVSKPIATPAAAAPAATPKAGEQPVYGGTLSTPIVADPPDLDIHRNSSGATFAVTAPVNSSVLQYDPLNSDKIIPDLAERWEASTDGKAYTFHLRKNVKWHDGKAFTSSDAKFSIDRLKEFAGLRFLMQGVSQSETPDDNTLSVKLDFPLPALPYFLAHGRIQIGAKHVAEAKGSLKWDVVGTGPYKLKEYSAGVGAFLVKNADYFIKGRPYLDAINFFVIKDASTRLAAFRSGRVNMVGVPPDYGIGQAQVEALKAAMPEALILPYLRLAGLYFAPNGTVPPWNDVRIRRAAFLAMDRQKGVQVVAQGVGELGMTGVYGEWAIQQNELLKMPGFRQPKDADIAEAKKLMADAGYPNGLKSSIIVRAGYPEYERGATYFRDQLARIGIDLRLDILEYSVFLDRRAKRTAESMVSVSHYTLPDPTSVAEQITWKYGGQACLFDVPEIIALFEKQRVEMDTAKRKELLRELQMKVGELVPNVLMGWINAYVGLAPEVRNYKPSKGLNNNLKLQDVWLAK